MAEAVAALLVPTTRARTMARTCTKRAAEFSWRKAAAQTLAVYKKVHESVRSRDPITTENSAIASAMRGEDPR